MAGVLGLYVGTWIGNEWYLLPVLLLIVLPFNFLGLIIMYEEITAEAVLAERKRRDSEKQGISG